MLPVSFFAFVVIYIIVMMLYNFKWFNTPHDYEDAIREHNLKSCIKNHIS